MTYLKDIFQIIVVDREHGKQGFNICIRRNFPDIGTGALADLHYAEDAQAQDCFPYGDAAYAERLGKYIFNELGVGYRMQEEQE